MRAVVSATPVRVYPRLPVAVVIATAAALTVRLALAARVPIVDDETYYWLWAQRLAWGYADHPPVIAVLITLGTRLFGNGTLAIRLIPLLLATASLPVLYLVGRDMFDAATGRRAVLLLMLMPIFTLGPALAFPDNALGLFGLVGVWSGWHALDRGGWWWVLAGVSVALALLTKLTGGFLLLGIGALWLGGPWRRSLRDRGWYAGLAVAVLLVLPTVWWYAHHRWVVVRMIWDRPPWLSGLSWPENLLYAVGGQILYHGALWPFLIAAIIWAARRRADRRWAYLMWTSAPILAAALPLAVVGQAKSHWPSPGYVAAAVALAALWPQWRRVRVLLMGAAALSGMFVVAAAVAGFLLAGQPVEGTGAGWRDAAQRIYEEAVRRDAFVLTSSYQSASQMLYHAPAPVPVTSPIGAFPEWEPPERLKGRNVLFVMEHQRADPLPVLAQMCRDAARSGEVAVAGGRTVTLYSCTDFSGSFAPYPLRGFRVAHSE